MQSRLTGTTCPFSGKVLDEYGLPTDETEGTVLELASRGDVSPDEYDETEVRYTTEEEQMMQAWLSDRIARVRDSYRRFGDTKDDTAARYQARGLTVGDKVDPPGKLFTNRYKTIKHLIGFGYSNIRISQLMTTQHGKKIRPNHVRRIRARMNRKADLTRHSFD